MSNWIQAAGICIVLVGVINGTRLDPECPRHRGLPDGYSRTENRYKDRALYRLDLRSALKGYIPGKEYKFRVQTTYRKLKFNDATVVIDPIDKRCGAGSWVTNTDDLYSPKDCPSIVTTQQKEPMGRAHFKWVAPSCGCVHFRARVHANSTYFIEDETERNGPLAMTICPKAGTVTEPVKTVPTTPVIPTVMTRNERLQLLCEVTEANKPADVVKNEDFMTRRTMSTLNSFELERLHIAVEQRHLDVLTCCDLDDEFTKMECFGDIRRVRIDTFCGNGEPDIPLTDSRYDWIKQKQSECCPQIGEDRYRCFNHTVHEDEMMGDSHGQHASIDMDDFDPVNYVEDYPQAADIRTKFSKKLEQTTKVSYQMEEDTKSSKKVQHDTEKQTEHSESRNVDVKHDIRSDVDDDDNDGMENEEDSGEKDEGTDEDDQAEKEKQDIAKSKTFTPEECCMNGIDAGTRVVAEGFDGCFNIADKFHQFFYKWNRQCDRHFVVCCMRVIDGDIQQVPESLNLRTILLPKHACRQVRPVVKFNNTVEHFDLLHLTSKLTDYKKERLKSKELKSKEANEIYKFNDENFPDLKIKSPDLKYNQYRIRHDPKHRKQFRKYRQNSKNQSLKRKKLWMKNQNMVQKFGAW